MCLFFLAFAILPSVPRDKDYPVCFTKSNCKSACGVGRGGGEGKQNCTPSGYFCLAQTQRKPSLQPPWEANGPAFISEVKKRKMKKTSPWSFSFLRKRGEPFNSHAVI